MSRVRADRVAHQIRDEISSLLQRGLRDPRVGFATITGVRVTTDLKAAKVFVSVYGDEDACQDTMAGLTSARGYLRTELARRLSIRHVPELTFHHDTSIEHGARMSKLLDQISGEREAREADESTSDSTEEPPESPQEGVNPDEGL